MMKQMEMSEVDKVDGAYQRCMELVQSYSVYGACKTQCQGTPAAVPMRANICVSALNKGSSGDPGAQSAVSRTMQGQVVSGIYTRNHSRYYLLIVTLLA
jgi:hypothetical protein